MAKLKQFKYHFPFWGILLSLCVGQIVDPPQFRSERYNMIESQIAARGVRDPNVLKAVKDVPRHLFVDESLWSDAYSDSPLPIGHGQTISQPYIVAFMTELLQLDTHHVVLEIGSGSGYQAAILSRLVHHVYTIEIVSALGIKAQEKIKQLGYDNISVKIGDGYKGWPSEAPFDRIIITAAPENIPPKLVEQLKPGGRMVLPVGPRWLGQELLILDKDSTGSTTTKKTIPVRFVPMIHGEN